MQPKKRDSEIKSLEQMVLMSASAVDGTDAGEWLAACDNNNVIEGHGGDDEFYAPSGNNRINGGDGNDILYVYEGKRSDYILEKLPDGTVRLEGVGLNNEWVTNTLTDVERISFRDGVVWIGQDDPSVLNGTNNSDWLSGSEFTDLIQAFGGDDAIYAPIGVNEIDGGDGYDTVIVYEGKLADYIITHEDDGGIRIKGPGLNGEVVENVLRNVERVLFNDRSLELTTPAPAPVAAEPAARQLQFDPLLVDEAPVAEVPIQQTPAEQTPVEEPPAPEQPVEQTPVEEPPAPEQPVEQTPVEEPPAAEEPVEQTPVEESPAAEQPIEQTPVEDPPAAEEPVEQTPVEESPVAQEPAEQTPVEESPAAEEPVEQTPVEEPPASETPVADIAEPIIPAVDVDPPHEFVQRVVDLTNEFRLQNGLSLLGISFELQQAAQQHSSDLAHADYFSHTGLDGRQPWDRAEDSGYNYYTIGENIAAGQLTPEEVVQAWIDSPPHLENLMNPAFTEIGIGYEYLQDDTGLINYNHYWTQLFGTEF